MNAVKSEKPMSEEERLVRVEADIGHLQKTVEDERRESSEFRRRMEAFREKMDDFRVDTAREFARANQALQHFKIETAANFGQVREDMAKGFGDLRAEIERGRTWMAVTGASVVLMLMGSAVALARYLEP